MIDSYFFQNQLRAYLMQVARIFSGLKVETGVGECGDTEFISVPIALGSRDRVAAAIQAGNTKNRPFSLPALALALTSLSLPTVRKGIGVVDNRVFLKQGGEFPADLRVVRRVMPIPYIMGVELGIYASNVQQLHQILEQILLLFDPVLQIQLSDAPFDWTKLTTVELTGINNEENYPPGGDRRVLLWTLTFETPIYITAPADIRNDLIRKIIIQVGDLQGFTLNEFDDAGNLKPFTTEYYGPTVIET